MDCAIELLGARVDISLPFWSLGLKTGLEPYCLWWVECGARVC